MTAPLTLTITTPAGMLVNKADVRSVRAMDESGCFGILAKHSDLITVLADSVVRWRDSKDNFHYCAIRSGVLSVSHGNNIRIACREGLVDDNLEQLEGSVRQYRIAEQDVNQEEVIRQMRLHTQTMRQILRYLRPSSGSATQQEILQGFHYDSLFKE